MSRRNFLKTATLASLAFAGSGGGTSGAVVGPGLFVPKISLGATTISRLIAGWNPIGGHSHATPNLSRHMLEYFTPEKIDEFLIECEMYGINCWQCRHGDRAVAACRALQKRNSPMRVIVLHSERRQEASLDDVVRETNCFAVAHRATVTDSLFRARRYDQVRDYLKKVKDLGVLAGLSTCVPDHLKRVADEQWESDFFMAGFYNTARTVPEQESVLAGKTIVGEPFLSGDPEDMTAVVREVPRVCLAYQILAAGRSCYSPDGTERAFRYALENVKPADAIVVGMYPKFSNEIRENVRYVQKYGT